MKHDRADNTISYKFCFTHLGTSTYHIEEIIGQKENIKINKGKKINGELAKFPISEEKPAEIKCQIKTLPVSIRLKYDVFNKYKQLRIF